jgi:hypothetical protein
MEKNLNESFISSEEREGGEYEYTAEQLANVCNLDNHYKIPKTDTVISSKMIIDMGGIDAILTKLKT